MWCVLSFCLGAQPNIIHTKSRPVLYPPPLPPPSPWIDNQRGDHGACRRFLPPPPFPRAADVDIGKDIDH